MGTPLNIVLTGASGGIGKAIAAQLAADGHKLTLLGRDPEKLTDLQRSLDHPQEHTIVAADLLATGDRQRLVEVCGTAVGGVDVLINNAGVSKFSMLKNTSDADIDRILKTNLMTPMLLTRDLQPYLGRSKHAMVINIGSCFGNIGYPGFSAYSASKFGLRGFTEALRREYADQSIAVHYLAPRAVRTSMNSSAVVALNETLGNQMDSPDVVANAVRKLLSVRTGRNRLLGWPERCFALLNSMIPSVIDRALHKQLGVVERYAEQSE